MFETLVNLPQSWKRFLLLSSDLLLAPLGLLLALALQNNTFWPLQAVRESLSLFPIVVLIAWFTSSKLGIQKIKLNAYEFHAILKTGAFTAAVAALSGVVSAYMGVAVPASVFAIFGLIFFLLAILSRFAGLAALNWVYDHVVPRKRILVYGAGSTGVRLVTYLRQSKSLNAVAFADDNPSLQNMSVAGLPVHPPRHLQKIIHDEKIDRVIVALPSLPQVNQTRITRSLLSLGCEVHVLPSYSDIVDGPNLLANLEPLSPDNYLGRNQLDKELPGVSENYADKSVLVSGAGGSIGSELCRQIYSCNPKQLILLDHSEPALYALDQELRQMAPCQGQSKPPKIIPVLGSVCDKNHILQVLITHRVEIILHAAAYKHVPMVENNEIVGLKNNVLGTKTIADAAHQAHVKHFVLVSTDKAVRPTNVMGASKRLAEMVVQDLATRNRDTLYSMVRFGNVLGSSGSVIPLFQDQIAKGGPVTLTHSDVTRYFMTIPEAARLVLLAGSFSRGGDVFVLDMGKPIPIRILAQQMIEKAGYTVKTAAKPHGDIEIVVTGLRPGEKLYEELLIGADLQTTPHAKILRAHEDFPSEIEMAGVLKELLTIVEDGDAVAARKLISRWVEGYASPRKDGTLQASE